MWDVCVLYNLSSRCSGGIHQTYYCTEGINGGYGRVSSSAANQEVWGVLQAPPAGSGTEPWPKPVLVYFKLEKHILVHSNLILCHLNLTNATIQINLSILISRVL